MFNSNLPHVNVLNFEVFFFTFVNINFLLAGIYIN